MARLTPDDVLRQAMDALQNIYIALEAVDCRRLAGRQAMPKVIKNKHANAAIEQTLDQMPVQSRVVVITMTNQCPAADVANARLESLTG